VSGQLAGWFWGLVAVVGLALPLSMALRGLLAKEGPKNPQSVGSSEGAEGAEGASCASGESDDAAVVASRAQATGDGQAASGKSSIDVPTLVGALGALVGGCALRFLVLAAGVHADVVAETIYRMIN
ncbi:MAG TPA: hypothetical protein K8U77_05810, partial [Slackia equolifaciens]|nr:hypothetical protein [Slackia equolifaciens]